MGLDIVTNIMADQASNDLSTNQANMQSSLQELSSGYAINTAADDASGLVISQHLQAQIGGFQQAQSNTQAGINVVQTADGALNEVSTILQGINTLAVESQNSSATDSTAQQAAQSEVNQALQSISEIAQTTVYGDNSLLVNGTSTSVNYTFQVGYDGSTASQVAFSVSALSLANLGLVMNTATGSDITDASGDVTAVDSNLAAGNYSYAVNVNATAGTATITLNEGTVVLGTANVSATATSASISLASGVSVNLTLSGTLATTTGTFSQVYSDPDALNYSVTGANAISAIQNAIQTVASLQGQFGAYQNELQDISDNETVGIQNLTASNASIMDTNMASQMVNFTQDQVLVQAGVSMLAQANQIPQYVLKLLS